MESDSHRRKLEETVAGILKTADLETATELSVRTEAAKLLGVDLSDLASKRLVRRFVESFLLSSSSVEKVRDDSGHAVIEEVQPEKSRVDDRKIACDDDGGRVICQLPGMRKVSIQKFKGTTLVSIREYYEKHGKVFPSGKGISLNPSQWSAFRSSFPDIEVAISKMESKIRPKGVENQQTEAEAEAFPPHPLVPITTARFTGKNFYCWKRQMEFFLNQLKVSYVLIEPCPNIPVSPHPSLDETSRIKVKVKAQKWVNDDYVCRHSILSSLSDQLFDRYSPKTSTARELWDELNSFYGDDFGTKRSHVNNYVQFQMVEGVSVLEQVQELHRIADTISASGTRIDEDFHVSAIISKLPSSWRQSRARLMQMEHLPLEKLVCLLKDEEGFRNQHKNRLGTRKKCYGCGKEGHIRRDCPLTKPYRRGQRDEIDNDDVVPVSSEVNDKESQQIGQPLLR